MRMGVLGGTFDPPHYGHLVLAEQARQELALGQILWVPAADPPHKQGQRITPVRHRLAMLQLAIADNPAFTWSNVDIDRAGPHYTADMLELLMAAYSGSSLILLLGEDSLRDLPTWHQPKRVLSLASLAVMRRWDSSLNMDLLETALPGVSSQVHFLQIPRLDISGQYIRAKASAGWSVRYLLPDSVAGYIAEHDLYRDLLLES